MLHLNYASIKTRKVQVKWGELFHLFSHILLFDQN